MKTEERIAILESRLKDAFSPSRLEIIDDSWRHKGHEGAKEGAGHYTVTIIAEALSNKSRVEAHREIYNLFPDLIPRDVHALQIKILK